MHQGAWPAPNEVSSTIMESRLEEEEEEEEEEEDI